MKAKFATAYLNAVASMLVVGCGSAPVSDDRIGTSEQAVSCDANEFNTRCTCSAGFQKTCHVEPVSHSKSCECDPLPPPPPVKDPVDFIDNDNATPADISAWLATYPKAFRANIVATALNELKRNNPTSPFPGVPTIGLCNDDALNLYDHTLLDNAFSGEWCSEFAAHVFAWAGAIDKNGLYDAHDVDDMETVWNDGHAWWIERNTFNPNLEASGAQPGDYLAMVGSDGRFHHSEIVVGVSRDMTQIYTVAGNVHIAPWASCVAFNKRPYIANGELNLDFDAFGKADWLF